MGRARTVAQRISYAAADRAAEAQARRIAFSGDRRDQVTAKKRDNGRDSRNQRSHAAARVGECFAILVDVIRLGRRITSDAIVKPRLMLSDHIAHDHRCRRSSVWLPWIDDMELSIVSDRDTQAVMTVPPANAAQLEFLGRLRGLPSFVSGGIMAARTYWAEARL